MQMSSTAIEDYIWGVERYLMRRYGSTQARIDIDPLKWYIVTGRAPSGFIKAMMEKKPYTIARILHKDKMETYNGTLSVIKRYIGFKEA